MDQGSASGFREISRRCTRIYVEHSYDCSRGLDKAKPFKGFEGGVFEIALKYRGDAFRVLYAVKIGTDIWVIHAFQKKSKSGIKTPHADIDLIRERLKRLKEILQ